MIKLLPILLFLLPFSLFAQFQVVLNSGDTATVSNVIEEGDFYTLQKEDGRTSKVAKDMIRAVIRDYPNSGNEAAFVYCELIGIQKFLSTQVTISVDYGQRTRFFQDNRLKDETGNVQSFNSMVDALNYMGSFGWEFVQAYVVTAGNQNVYRWLLKKKK